MWKRMLSLLVVLSVALNIGFVGVWGFRALRVRGAGAQPYEGPVWCPLHRELGVTSEQWRLIEPKLESFHQQSQALCRDMGRLRAEMIDLISVQDPDLGAIAAKQKKIRAGQQQMQELVIEHLLAEKEILTADQEEKLFQMLRGQSPHSRPGRMLRFGNTDKSDRSSSQPKPTPETFPVNVE